MCGNCEANPQVYYCTEQPAKAIAGYAFLAPSAELEPIAYYEAPTYPAWQCQPIQPAPTMTCTPAFAAPPAYGAWYTPEDKKKKKKKAMKWHRQEESSSDDSDDDENEWGAYYCTPTGGPTPPKAPAGWMVVDPEKSKKKKKKKAKDQDQDAEYVMHYVPAGEKPDAPDGIRADGKYHYSWYGRSKDEVEADRLQQAIDAGVWKCRDKIPDAGKGDKFWVVDGRTNVASLQAFGVIREKFKGEWKVDPTHGNDFFVKKGEKNSNGWDD